jgi:ABC-type glycerol-3-phosphate transport system substrate-binding protein
MRMSLIGATIMLAGSLLVFASGCKDNSSSPTAPPTSSSSITTISMAVHTTITWNNNSSIAHTSTSDVAGKWDTGNIPAGSSKQTTFDSTGTFHYHCTYHSGMTGTITVQ